jgi:hypothetical protein
MAEMATSSMRAYRGKVIRPEICCTIHRIPKNIIDEDFLCFPIIRRLA